MNNLQVLELRGQRVLTTKQIAENYKVAEWQIKQNYQNNKKYYAEGKHYIILTGEELRSFKSKVEKIYPVGRTANKLYLWTEKGALLHAKSINTDKAWEVYDYLVDHYFRSEEIMKKQAYEELCRQQVSENTNTVVNVPENYQIQTAIKKIKDDLVCMNVLLDSCSKYISVQEYLERRSTALKVLDIVIADFTKLIEIKPRLLQKSKQYC